MPRVRKVNPSQDPKYQNALKERDRAMGVVRQALQATGNVIRTWVEHFDRNYDASMREVFALDTTLPII